MSKADAPAKTPSKAVERYLANLKVREARIKDKLENRIPGAKFMEGHSEETATSRAQKQLADIQAAIKKASKS
jgi:hypothetical protein